MFLYQDLYIFSLFISIILKIHLNLLNKEKFSCRHKFLNVFSLCVFKRFVFIFKTQLIISSSKSINYLILDKNFKKCKYQVFTLIFKICKNNFNFKTCKSNLFYTVNLKII
jgi:hypothetical protein